MRVFLSLYKPFERSSFRIPAVFPKYSFIQTYLRLTLSTTTTMGKGLARLIGSGIAFTSEAAHAARHRNKDSVSETTRSISGVESDCGDSVGAGSRTTYTVALEGRAELPNREGRSEWGSERGLPTGDELPPYSPGSERQRDINDARSSSEVEEKRGYRSSETGNDTENLTLDTKNDRERSMDGDEAAWQLDEATEEFGLPTYDQTETHPGPKGAQRDFDMSVDNNNPDEISAQDSEDEKAKKRERMIRSLVAMAGPPPAQPQRLPCPVIIPQRRPGAKKRGFVRAYAPVLADCGVSQDVFLKFISDFHKASQVGDYHCFS